MTLGVHRVEPNPFSQRNKNERVMKPHVHKEVITAYANGASIQVLNQGKQIWEDAKNPVFRDDHQYRVKPAEPERKTPRTNMTSTQLHDIWSKTPAIHYSPLMNVANAALEDAYESGQIVTREEFDRAVGDRKARDMKIAGAVAYRYWIEQSPCSPTDEYLSEIIKGVKP